MTTAPNTTFDCNLDQAAATLFGALKQIVKKINCSNIDPDQLLLDVRVIALEAITAAAGAQAANEIRQWPCTPTKPENHA